MIEETTWWERFQNMVDTSWPALFALFVTGWLLDWWQHPSFFTWATPLVAACVLWDSWGPDYYVWEKDDDVKL